MSKILNLEPFEPFTHNGVMVSPVNYELESGEWIWIVPDGWQNVLNQKGISYTEMEI